MNKWNKAILGIFLFMLGSFIICGSLTDKLISNFTKKTIDTTLSTKYAGCSVTGTEGALTTTTASSSDATSGINNWYCHKIDGAWEVCPNSSGCTSYKLTGWLGYDKVKAFDKAGNESSETDLYTIVSETKEGTTKFKVSFAKNVGTNPLHIKDYEATVGEITDARIFKDANNNEKIKLTGNPEKVEITKVDDHYSLAGIDYLCEFGKPVEVEKGVWKCAAESYRLQNETCSCVFDVKTTAFNNIVRKVYSISSTGSYAGCQRYNTFCSDKYNSTGDTDVMFKVITKPDMSNPYCKPVDGNDMHCYSSNYFDRPLNSSCFTYYNNASFTNVFSNTKNNNWYTSYSDYVTKLDNSNGNYKKGDVTETAKNLMFDKSKSIDNPCNSNNSEAVNDKEEYISSGSWYKVCDTIMDKLNAGKEIYGVTTDDDQYMVPFVGSAQCIFNEDKAMERANFNTYSSYPNKYDDKNNIVYYCDKGELVERDGTYQCKVTEITTNTTYKYNWTVRYYRKK